MALPADILLAARELLEAGWTPPGLDLALARDRHGVPCTPLYSGAIVWSIEGALQAAAHYARLDLKKRDENQLVRVVLDVLLRQIRPETMQGWQNTPGRTQAQVLELVRKSQLRMAPRERIVFPPSYVRERIVFKGKEPRK